MGERSDIFRSFVRHAADRATQRLGPLGSLGKRLRQFARSAGTIPNSAITKAVGRATNVTQASCVCRDGRIWVEVCFGTDDWVRASFAPAGSRFAPRGPKELTFDVEPPEMANKAAVRDLVAALAALVAHTLWAPLLGPQQDPVFDAIAERDGTKVRVDLRTVPAVRAAMQGPMGQMFDALELGRAEVVDEGLRIGMKLPPLLGP